MTDVNEILIIEIKRGYLQAEREEGDNIMNCLFCAKK